MEKCIVAVSLAALIAVTMGQFYALICDEIGKKEEKYELKFLNKKLKNEESDERSRGRMLV
jgi:hypothetical protein